MLLTCLQGLQRIIATCGEEVILGELKGFLRQAHVRLLFFSWCTGPAVPDERANVAQCGVLLLRRFERPSRPSRLSIKVGQAQINKAPRVLRRVWAAACDVPGPVW